jgi:tRNA pseudouridine38-40 synthase
MGKAAVAPVFVRTVKLIIGFIGTRYEGWQSQRNNRTLQELLEKSLFKILREKVPLISSSRTDSGVHALGLATHFKTQSKLPDSKLKQALNFYLPKDVIVFSVKTMPNDFHARYHAKSKVYRYSIWNSGTRPLFEAPFVWWCPQPLNLVLMRKAAAFLEGKHDFSAFKDAGGDDLKSAVREIKRITIRKKKSLLIVEVEGSGFLRHMIRIIVGTLVQAGRGKMAPQQVRTILRSKDRKLAGPTAKAKGLMLMRVKFKRPQPPPDLPLH